eukprot:CAMPEP_0174835792 /NCGR_PEP_ID=MMETSP1114-20130205/5605_1 /TAXON_ID=312471 /ORGANISM="Neobodo designis, Strain CCAP 1951/1" /LENGTH=365 /DNA_ID=CAMNT_0016069747 /DNA_START=774 /DNA_END=1869 /DNA_ORIENTATION=-
MTGGITPELAGDSRVGAVRSGSAGACSGQDPNVGVAVVVVVERRRETWGTRAAAGGHHCRWHADERRVPLTGRAGTGGQRGRRVDRCFVADAVDRHRPLALDGHRLRLPLHREAHGARVEVPGVHQAVQALEEGLRAAHAAARRRGAHAARRVDRVAVDVEGEALRPDDGAEQRPAVDPDPVLPARRREARLRERPALDLDHGVGGVQHRLREPPLICRRITGRAVYARHQQHSRADRLDLLQPAGPGDDLDPRHGVAHGVVLDRRRFERHEDDDGALERPEHALLRHERVPAAPFDGLLVVTGHVTPRRAEVRVTPAHGHRIGLGRDQACIKGVVVEARADGRLGEKPVDDEDGQQHLQPRVAP